MKKQAVAKSKKINVTFEAPGPDGSDSLAVVGDFNNWDGAAMPMKRKKDGIWSASVRLEPGTYRYRFLADGKHYFNDAGADAYEPSGYGDENCVVVVE